MVNNDVRIMKLQQEVRELTDKLQQTTVGSGAAAAIPGGQASSSRPLMVGNLFKKSKYFKSFEERAVVLSAAGMLSWDGGGSHRGFVELGARSSVKKETGAGAMHAFTVFHDGKRIELGAESETVVESWVAAIQKYIESLQK